jgi:hypothetical protein
MAEQKPSNDGHVGNHLHRYSLDAWLLANPTIEHVFEQSITPHQIWFDRVMV